MSKERERGYGCQRSAFIMTGENWERETLGYRVNDRGKKGIFFRGNSSQHAEASWPDSLSLLGVEWETASCVFAYCPLPFLPER